MLDDRLLALYNARARLAELRTPRELRRRLAINAELSGRHAGRRCYVVGNGPSVKEQDLTLLHDELTFAVNRFIEHPLAEKIAPDYYCIVDPKFALGQWGSDFVKRIERRLPHTTLILTAEGFEFCEREGVCGSHKKYVVNPNQYFYFGYDRDIDLTGGIPGADNVTKVALSAAVYMGCSEINLVGIDGNGLILSENSHFYGHEPQPADQVALEKALVSMSLGLRGWRAIAEYLERRGIRLVSRNPRSVLRALPQGPFPWDAGQGRGG